MLTFVNAKINLGLRVVSRLPNGYHELETIFYPVGLYNGKPECPYPFCDMLELTAAETEMISIDGAKWPTDKDLTFKARELFRSLCERKGIEVAPMAIRLEKHLPVQAGLGGGSADGAFMLKMLNKVQDNPLSEDELAEAALKLGADCPFFLLNKPALGNGIGEQLTPLHERLRGLWCVIVKPAENMSTREAFARITPAKHSESLTSIYESDFDVWRKELMNDFEKPFLDLYPHCGALKEGLYASGALYASLSGSGASFYGIFSDKESAEKALLQAEAPFKALVLL